MSTSTPEQATALADLLRTHGLLDAAEALREHVVKQRWFAGRESGAESLEFRDLAVLGDGYPPLLFAVARLHGPEGHTDYHLLLSVRHPDDAGDSGVAYHTITETETSEGRRLIVSALNDHPAAFRLWELIRSGAQIPTTLAALRFTDHGVSAEGGPEQLGDISAEQSNTALTRDNREFLKFIRKHEPGPSVEQEMISALSRAGFTAMPALLGEIDYAREGRPDSLVGLVVEYMHNGTDGWALALTSLRDLYADAEEAELRSIVGRLEAVEQQGGDFTAEAARLGRVTAEMHLALVSEAMPEQMRAAPVTPALLQQWATQMDGELTDLLQRDHPLLAPLQARAEVLRERIAAVASMQDAGAAIRIHGDYHLGQVMRTDSGWHVIDFGGEPMRTPEQRRQRMPAMRDVAGMMRSLDYAAGAALAERMSPDDSRWETLARQGDAWAHANREAFWHAYLERAGDTPLITDAGAALALRRAFEIQKAIYEIVYEINHRPQWVPIPLRFLLQAVP